MLSPEMELSTSVSAVIIWAKGLGDNLVPSAALATRLFGAIDFIISPFKVVCPKSIQWMKADDNIQRQDTINI